MIIDVALSIEPLQLSEHASLESGAVIRFEGRVRQDEDGKRITALYYEAYQPMAQKQMELILTELRQDYPCHIARVRHRVGAVPVGDAAILIEVGAKHRAEAIGLVTAFMDRLKQDVPIWKLHSILTP